jgi:hypothetical protein
MSEPGLESEVPALCFSVRGALPANRRLLTQCAGFERRGLQSPALKTCTAPLAFSDQQSAISKPNVRVSKTTVSAPVARG